jgi:sulfite reductase (NADPH) hemoprotein beta-component
VIGFTDTEEKTLKAIYEVLTIQRDYGNRSDRKLARLKYTIDKVGVAWFKEELERRIGFQLAEAKPIVLTERVDHFGWKQNAAGKWFYTVLVENGRILDSEQLALKTALYEVAKTGKANFRFTCTQNLILSDIEEANKQTVHAILEKFGVIVHTEMSSAIRKNSMACVALPTCPLALAEAQRYLPELITKIEPILEKYGLEEDGIILRMTGCPNGCARSYVAEIGFVGTAMGKYNVHLGGDRQGERLNKIYRESLEEPEILQLLDLLLKEYSIEKKIGETFGDFSVRKEWITYA